MASRMFSKSVASLVIFSSMATASFAGGFSRGDANTDILFEDGNFVFDGGFSYIAPHRGYDTINGAKSSDSDYSDDYFIPNLAAKARITEAFSCALTYTQPFGASSEYGPAAQAADRANTGNATTSAEFSTDEYGATCRVKFDASKGNFSFLGGVFLQTFDYTEKTDFGTLHLEDDGQVGYRIGAAYEIPEYALRAQLMYRSQIKHEADGEFSVSPTGALVLPALIGLPAGSIPAGTEIDSSGYGTLPQSLELSLQSGVAEGWLVYGSVKWTDWSVLQQLNYNVGPLPLTKNFFFRDGWTVQAGVAHSFTDNIAGTVNLTWDRGVGDGADVMTDVWTLGVGAQVKVEQVTWKIGGGLSYLTSGSQTFNAATGAPFDATVDGDWAFGATTSLMVKF